MKRTEFINHITDKWETKTGKKVLIIGPLNDVQTRIDSLPTYMIYKDKLKEYDTENNKLIILDDYKEYVNNNKKTKKKNKKECQ